jgi:hypothetical protein
MYFSISNLDGTLTCGSATVPFTPLRAFEGPHRKPQKRIEAEAHPAYPQFNGLFDSKWTIRVPQQQHLQRHAMTGAFRCHGR